MASLPDLGELPVAERVMLLHQMGVFTHGLAVRICSGLAEHHTFTDLIVLLKDAGEAMIGHAVSEPVRSAEQTALIQSLIDHNTKEIEGHD